MGLFRRMVDDLLLKEATLVGHKFTWSNDQEVPTLVRLDHWFSSVDWELTNPDCMLTALSSSI
jgi:hypothetical protein